MDQNNPNKQPRKINTAGANAVPTQNRNNLKNNNVTFKHNANVYDYDKSHVQGHGNINYNSAQYQKPKQELGIDTSDFVLNANMLSKQNFGSQNVAQPQKGSNMSSAQQNYTAQNQINRGLNSPQMQQNNVQRPRQNMGGMPQANVGGSRNISINNAANSSAVNAPRTNGAGNANRTVNMQGASNMSGSVQRGALLQNNAALQNNNVLQNSAVQQNACAPQNNSLNQSLNINSNNTVLPPVTGARALQENAELSQSGGFNNTQSNIKAKKSRKKLNVFLNILSVACCVFLTVYIGLQTYAGTIINTGEFGTVSKTYATPPEHAGDELNLLVLGIDYTSEDGQGRSPNGQTDVIMYVRFNFEDNTIRMLQIPRDVYVGEEIDHGGTGKINAVYGQAPSDEDRINSLAYVLYEQYKLPVDNYVSIDMDSLREVVDLFGGVEVYIEQDMYFEGSSLKQGMQVLDGAAAEFFVRFRNYPTGDIARLSNQRNFYSALFSMVRSVTWQEIVRLTPIVQSYINTDLNSTDCAALAIELLSVPSSNILLAILPVADASQNYNGLEILVAEPNATADMLNEYFRPEGTEVPVTELAIPQLPKNATLYETNVQWMSDVDESSGREAGQAADAAVTGEDILDEIEQAEQAEVAAAASVDSTS